MKVKIVGLLYSSAMNLRLPFKHDLPIGKQFIF